jgi:hypothetical protein
MEPQLDPYKPSPQQAVTLEPPLPRAVVQPSEAFHLGSPLRPAEVSNLKRCTDWILTTLPPRIVAWVLSKFARNESSQNSILDTLANAGAREALQNLLKANLGNAPDPTNSLGLLLRSGVEPTALDDRIQALSRSQKVDALQIVGRHDARSLLTLAPKIIGFEDPILASVYIAALGHQQDAAALDLIPEPNRLGTEARIRLAAFTLCRFGDEAKGLVARLQLDSAQGKLLTDRLLDQDPQFDLKRLLTLQPTVHGKPAIVSLLEAAPRLLPERKTEVLALIESHYQDEAMFLTIARSSARARDLCIQVIENTCIENSERAARMLNALQMREQATWQRIITKVACQSGDAALDLLPYLPDQGLKAATMLSAVETAPRKVLTALRAHEVAAEDGASVMLALARKVPALADRSRDCDQYRTPEVNAALVSAIARKSPLVALKRAIELGISEDETLTSVCESAIVKNGAAALSQVPWDKVANGRIRQRLVELAADNDLAGTLKQLELLKQVDPKLITVVLGIDECDNWPVLFEVAAREQITDVALLMRLISNCSRSSPGQVLVGYAQLTERQRALAVPGIERFCRDRSPEAFKALDLDLPIDRLKAFALHFASTRPFEVLEKIGSANLDQSERAHLLECAIKKKPRVAIQQLASFDVHDPAYKFTVLQEAAARGATHLRALLRLNWAPVLSSAQALGLLAALPSSDVRHLTSLATELSVDPAEQHRLELLALASKGSTGLRAAPARQVLQAPHTAMELVKSFLLKGDSVGALKCARAHYSVTGQTVRESQVLASYDTCLAEILATNELRPSLRRELELISRIRKSGAIPSKRIVEAFEHFDDKADAALCRIIAQAGPTFGESITQQLVGLFRRMKETSISPLDEKTILAFIHSGYRGFSARTFRTVRSAMEDSEREATAVLDRYARFSRTILTGGKLEDKGLSKSERADLCYAAFRPVGMSLSEVRGHLESVKDHSDRLEGWNFPSEGFELNLHTIANLSLREGTQLDANLLNKLTDALTGAIIAPKQQKVDLLDRAVQRTAAQVPLAELVAAIAPCDKRCKPMLARLQRLADQGFSVDEAYAAIPLHSELLEEVLPKAIHEYVASTLRSMPARERAALAEKAEGMVPGELTEASLVVALSNELVKPLASAAKLVRAEAKKFIIEPGAQTSDIRMFISLNTAAFLARAAAGLCTGDDLTSWDSENYLQGILVDLSRARVVGCVQFHTFRIGDETSLLARPNPTTTFLNRVDKSTLIDEVMRVVRQFAKLNDMRAFTPVQDSWHVLTNRTTTESDLEAYQGESVTVRVFITDSEQTLEVCPILERRKAA